MKRTLLGAAVVVLALAPASRGQDSNAEQLRRSLETQLTKLDQQEAKLTAEFNALKQEEAKADADQKAVEANKRKHEAEKQKLVAEVNAFAAKKQQYEAKLQQYRAKSNQYGQKKEAYERDNGEAKARSQEIDADRARLDRRNRNALNSFNAKVNAHNATLPDLRRRFNELKAEREANERERQAVKADFDALESLRKALRQRLHEASMASARDHADWTGLQRRKSALQAKRDDLNVAKNTLRDERADVKRRVSLFNASVSSKAPSARIPEGDELRKAREDARKAEEERKRLEKEFHKK